MKTKEWKPFKDIRATLETGNNLITECCILDGKWSEAYSEPCRTSNVQLFAKLVNGLKLWWWWIKNEQTMVSHSKFSLLQSRIMAFFPFGMSLTDAIRDWNHKSFHTKDFEFECSLTYVSLLCSKCRTYSRKLDIRQHLILAKKGTFFVKMAPQILLPPIQVCFCIETCFVLK